LEGARDLVGPSYRIAGRRRLCDAHLYATVALVSEIAAETGGAARVFKLAKDFGSRFP